MGKETGRYKVLEGITINGGGYLEKGSYVSMKRYNSISKFSPELVKFFEKVVASKATKQAKEDSKEEVKKAE